MPIGQMQFYSPALRRKTIVGVYVPTTELAPPYPALLQLHGAGDNHSSWFESTMLPVQLHRYPFVVITPAGDLSGWSNVGLKGPGTEYEEYLVGDLMPEMERIFPIRRGRWAIGGLSMGGVGAIRLGLLYPDRFASIYAHSSALFLPDEWEEWIPNATEEDVAATDFYAFADRAARLPDRPALSFDCGVDDELLPYNRAFHEHLEKIGYPHTYREFPGGHTWEYWNQHVEEALARHLEVISATAP
jgi:S-formylglutathione hydrolase FrmB